MVALESRAEMAEAERDAAAGSMMTMTPRPARPAPAAAQLLGAEGADLLQQVVQHYRCAQSERLLEDSGVRSNIWPSLAQLLDQWGWNGCSKSCSTTNGGSMSWVL